MIRPGNVVRERNVHLALAVSGVVSGTFDFGPVALGQGPANLCALLPQSDVSSAVGTPLKLVDRKAETNSAGATTLRSQACNYDPPGGLGSGPIEVRVNITEAPSATTAAQLFKAETQTLSMVAGKGAPLSGVGDEAQSFQAPGSVSMRKKNVVADIRVGRRDLNLDKEIEMGKALALKIAAKIP